MQNTATDPTTQKLPLREKISYGLGDVGSNMLLDIGTLYLLKFYTDVLGIPGAWGGVIFLISKFFTAFTDIGTGLMLDARKNIGPQGKFRPFIRYAAIPVMLLAIANFIDTPFDLTGKIITATVLFMLFGVFFSMMNCSYGAMVPAMTKNPNERAQLAAFRQGGATLGLLVNTVAFVPILNYFSGTGSSSYALAASCFAVVGFIFMMFCVRGVKERYISVPENKGQKVSLLNSFKAITSNRPLFVLCMANLCTLGAFNIKLAIQVYYTQYVLHDASLLAMMGFFSISCILVGVFMVPTVVRLFGKKPVYIGGLLLWAVGDVLNYNFGSTSTSFVVFSCLAFFGSAFVNSLNWALVSDTVEYGEWRSGVRSEGTVYTGFTFFRKVSQALAGLIPGVILTAIGYVPNVEQSPTTIEGLRQLIFIWPCGLAIATMIIMLFFYNLTEKNYVKIVQELEARKQAH